MLDILTNPITVSVLLMCVLCLLKINVLLSLVVAAIVGGTLGGMGLGETFATMIQGMSGNAETALSYVFLGAFAAALAHSGIADILSRKISSLVKGRKIVLLLILVICGCISGTLIPVHIAFIPILVPPLIGIMNTMKMDRRSAACALGFGLTCPYITIPVGYGLIFHTIIASQMTENGIPTQTMDVWKACWILGIGMLAGLIGSLFYYRKNRVYEEREIEGQASGSEIKKFGKDHIVSLAAIAATLVFQLSFNSMPLGAVAGLAVMIIGGAVKLNDIDTIMNEGVKIMGLIGFVMMIASGYANVIKSVGAVDSLITASLAMLGDSRLIAAIVMILIGLITTLGIGTSFGTVPILAVLYVPLGLQLGFSKTAIIILITAAAALGDAGSPASSTTLGPSAGLNADGQHNHIWDTCVPTFIFFNIPLVLFGLLGAMLF